MKSKHQTRKLVLAIAFSLSSCGDAGEGRVVPTEPVAGTERAALPGESQFDATQRLIAACMDRYSESFEEADVLVNGESRSVRIYSSSQLTQSRLSECTQSAEADLGLEIGSEEELRRNYDNALTIVECLNKQGYEMGATPSWEEFLARDGDTPLSSNFEDLMQTEAFFDKLTLCSRSLTEPP